MLRLEEVQCVREEVRRRDEPGVAAFELDERARGRVGEKVIGQVGQRVDDVDVALERRRVVSGEGWVTRRRVVPARELRGQTVFEATGAPSGTS